jgi:hypothetical protein
MYLGLPNLTWLTVRDKSGSVRYQVCLLVSLNTSETHLPVILVQFVDLCPFSVHRHSTPKQQGHERKYTEGVMEELDRSSLHPLIKHPETDTSRPGIELRPPASQAGTLPKS